MPNISVLQPDSTQTFMVKPSYSGTEYYFTAAELMAFVKASYPACDSLILLPYAYSSFGYFIGYFTIGTVNDLNFRNEDLDIAMNCWVAHDALNATTVSFAAINNDGTGLGNQMGSGVSWSSLTDQSTGKTWLHIDANFNEPLVLYTECNYTTLYINGVTPTPPGPTPVLWEQILFGNSVLFSEGTIVNFDACENSWTWRQQDQQELDNINLYLTGEMINSRQLPIQTTEVYRKGSYYITICQELPSSTGPGVDIIFGKDGETPQLTFSSGANGNKQQGYKFAIAINETNQQGALVGGFITYDNYYAGVGRWLSNTSSASTATNLYNWLKAAKPEKATVRVNYYLPDYDYTYAKLVYKKDSAPSSETDGTSIEILKDESEVIVENLQGNSKYFFEIFTDKSESDPKDIDIGSVTPAYSVKNLEVLKDFNKTYNILVYTQTAGLYIDMTPRQILDLFNTMYGNYNCIWITYIDYSQGYNIHAAHLEIPGTTLRIYSQEKLVPSITQNGWVFASAFVSSYVESAGHWVARRRSDQSIYLEHEDSLNHWLYTTEVTDPSLSQYSYTAGGGVSPSEPISSSDDTIYIAFYTSLQYTELYIDDIRVQ